MADKENKLEQRVAKILLRDTLFYMAKKYRLQCKKMPSPGDFGQIVLLWSGMPESLENLKNGVIL